MGKITKIQLSDGSIYGIFDNGALRLNADGVLVTGNEVVDSAILNGRLTIMQIDDIPVNQYINNVLVQDSVTGMIKKRSTNILLKDIGGTSHSMDEERGVLTLKLGK